MAESLEQQVAQLRKDLEDLRALVMPVVDQHSVKDLDYKLQRLSVVSPDKKS